MSKYDFNEIKEKLFGPALLDIIDELGYRQQGMDYGIRPLTHTDKKIMGTALTMNCVEVYSVPDQPYKNELEGLDLMKPGDVLVATTQGSMGSAFFGELMATRSTYRGCIGAIIDGASRDIGRIEEMGFPLFHRGISPYDSKGRMDVVEVNKPIVCGGVLVHPGDVIFADMEGVIVIPAAIVDEVIEKAIEKMRMEDIVRDEISKGANISELYDKYGVM